MKWVNKVTVYLREHKVGELSMVSDNKLCAFEYDKEWLKSGFSISPIELPLKPGLFLAKKEPFVIDNCEELLSPDFRSITIK